MGQIMRSGLALRWQIFKKIVRQPKFNIPAALAALWAVSGYYSNFKAEWAPEWMRPYLQSMINMIAEIWNIAGWYILFILIAVAFIAVFEFAVKQEQRIRALDWNERLKHSGKWNLPVYCFAPIEWSNFDHFLTRTSYSDKTRPPTVSGFRLCGLNRSKRPLRFKNAYIRALVGNNNDEDETISVWIENQPQNDIIINPGDEFTVIAKFPESIKGDIGLRFEEFRQRFSYFKFVFQTDRGCFEQEFTINDIDELLLPYILHFEMGPSKERKAFSVYEGKRNLES